MNKIKQNKITFTLILTLIAIIFSSLTILSLPVLFNYKSKVAKIEKNFYENFKFYLNSSGKVYYKPFPKPHLLVENATLNLSKNNNKNDIIKTSNLKIFISLRDVYLRSFQNFISTNISDTNINLKIDDIKEFRKHLYKTINNKVTFTNCKIFIRNEENKVILISQIKKISYKINNKTKIKNFLIDGKIFGLDFKSDWKRSYDKPKISINNIKIFNPNIDIKNIYNFENKKIFDVITEITHNQDKLVYNINFDNYKINIKSPNDKNTNFNLFGTIELRPFYFDGELVIRNKKVEKIIDNFLINFLLYDESF